ncbi:SGNH/GDSL hydrolase family protein [Facklamia miroungae]|uniref:Lysophospholipase L1 n=1 Tax=Facklamia miroungae TaxID=120956 RepID=A0A1G7QRM1_9LACT|nr:GDSL-type esterase/lipase family protein [Facklamia miroungae]NKZ29040.1 hypothetical protein [Facklamia miroungae]SDG01181.1 Lysophospholipase L1 [Facklamia miroungae]
MKTLIFLGHSILSLYTKNTLGDWQIRNISKQGIIAKDGLKIAKDRSEALKNSEAVLIMFGINELYYQMKQEGVIKYLKLIVQLIQRINPEIDIILSQIIQTKETDRLKPNKIDWVNQEIINISENYHTKILTWEQMYNHSGNIASEFTIDGIHLTKAGYEIFENRLLELLKR